VNRLSAQDRHILLRKYTPPVPGGVYESPQEKNKQNNGKRDSK